MHEQLVRPDFLIIGAMKAGTSTLVELLNQHPEISLPKKELYYFSNTKNYNKGHSWYSTQLLEAIKTPKKIIGEKCVGYSFATKSAERIFKFNPSIKFIWILRNPIDRTYSNYLHNLYNGLDSMPFKEALEQENSRAEQNMFVRYKFRSEYLTQLRNYLNFFTIDQFHFVEFDEFIMNQNTAVNKVLDFLDIKSYNFQPVHSNKTLVTVFPRLINYSINTFGYWSKPHQLLRRIKYPTSLVSPPSMGPAIEQELREFFSDHNIELEKLVKIKIEKWNK